MYQFYLSIVSSRVSTPPWSIDLTPFYLVPLPQKSSKSDRPPCYEQPRLKILEKLISNIKK